MGWELEGLQIAAFWFYFSKSRSYDASPRVQSFDMCLL